jgi:HAE1 family hydrophobic/amphiphilic exporter-1
VTVLAIIIVLVAGILTYRSLPVELFPEIEFPLVTVSTFYPSANPDAVVRDVSAPIENAISSVDGLDNVQSVSFEDRSLILANFKFGTDMAEAERTISSNIGGIPFPAGVAEPRVGRLNPNAFPVLQLSVLGGEDTAQLERVVRSLVLPAISSVDGVFSVEVTGIASREVQVTVDPTLLSDSGVSLSQVSNALRGNSATLPAGAITEAGRTFPVRTTNSYASLQEIRDLVVGFAGESGPPLTQGGPDSEAAPPSRPILLSEIADVSLGSGVSSSVSRTNGEPSVGIGIVKEPEANTVDVTSGVLEILETIQGLPSGIEFVTITNEGPEIQAQVDNLQREAILGFLFAVTVVFAFLITFRPSLWAGTLLTLRPTFVIGMSIPLSILTGILLMGLQGMSLNLMTLGGLAIAVGRVVDDSIVVLENLYRHIQRGDDRFRAALQATREVAPAITSSTLTTIVVFAPLAFIQGLVGSFFLPFAITVSFALAASLFVALTAVPVLGAIVLRPGDFRDDAHEGGRTDETWMQRVYTRALVWALGHKAATLALSLVVLMGSLGLAALIPVTLFPSGGERFLSVDVTLPPGTSAERTLAEVDRVEEVLAGLSRDGTVDAYQTTIGRPDNAFGPGAGPGLSGFGSASMFVRLTEDAPEDVSKDLRSELADGNGSITVTDLGGGPPTSGLEISITGSDYGAISAVATRLVADIGQLDGIVNLKSDVTEARDEIVIAVDPAKAAAVGLTVRDVGRQVSRFLVGEEVTRLTLDGVPTSVVLRGRAEDVDSIDKVGSLAIVGPRGSVLLGDVAAVAFEQGPVTIARSDGQRAASITGAITAEDTRKIGREVQRKIDAISLPPGVEITSGGIFQQVAEGFQDIFLAMGIGILLVYLVMVASLGSLRNPFVIIMSLPLALIGAMVALAVTGRTLGLPAMMGLLLLIGIVVTNAIVLIAFVEQLRERGSSIYDALVEGGRIRLRPILMTAFTTSFALLPLAAFTSETGGIIGAELATVVIGGLISSSFLTLIVVPVIYTLLHDSIPELLGRVGSRLHGGTTPGLAQAAEAANADG